MAQRCHKGGKNSFSSRARDAAEDQSRDVEIGVDDDFGHLVVFLALLVRLSGRCS